MNWIPKYKFILASKSPRRQELLKSLGIDFEVQTKDVDESYPNHLPPDKIPVYLAEKKAKAFTNGLNNNDLLITADTIVVLNDHVLEKPVDYDHAFQMLSALSGRIHEVITGVCLSSTKKSVVFSSLTNVQFKKLTNAEIDYYINTFKPYDKAGAYGIQEWIGSIGISHIEGSFYNVMGLPLQKLYEEFQKF
ncbi:Maf-like protein [Draconibacterium halophilum]|uniref:dTTP/UTP pyrophosphatase n=1 Tax=Draconibacterium halophilum TaxID=2706887 RepID=A0A6C0RFP6_9BACT|nr:Maf-like protein [Draconibacterium halophilum]QIA08897.1 septum formation protein Maf [Draconibacterium halophilum]